MAATRAIGDILRNYGTIYGTMKTFVIDTNVFISALISRRGASFKLLNNVGRGFFNIAISVPLILEYEDVTKRMIGSRIMLSGQDIDDIIDYLCSIAIPTTIYYLWRPTLNDVKDDMVLETAVAAGCQHIVTYNISDFREAQRFGIQPVTPVQILDSLGI